MMDFLRRLSPPRATDATRAVAVLPARFANGNPLQAVMDQAGPVRRPDDEEAPLATDAAAPPAPNSTLAAQRHPVTGVQSSQGAPRPFASEPLLRDDDKAASPPQAATQLTSPAHTPAEAPAIHVVLPRVLQDNHAANVEGGRSASPERQDLAAALAASPGLQHVAAPPAHARVALPLSAAILAQRTLESRDDSQVVHVTIGRIDVVANTAPAPVVRASAPPRQATVTLADYLRASKGGRQ